jgi:hydrophobic/amphiphilic exporter-1 (mainly G- bacteria), HAE1 family
MHPIEFIVRNPLKVWVGVILVTLFGFVAFNELPMQLTPEVQIPKITVETVWPGASPQEVEREILEQQEEQLKSAENLTKITSNALDSIARIELEFSVGTDLDVAATKVSKLLEQVRSYPENVDKPTVKTSGSADNPIAWFILSARLPDRAKFENHLREHPETKEILSSVMKALQDHRRGLAELRLRRLVAEHGAEHPSLKELMPPPIDVPLYRKFAENHIEAAFERVEGVANSNVIGGQEPELQIIVDPEKLAARQITIQQVRRALQSQNKDTSGGDIWEGKRRYVVRTLGQFKSPEQVGEQLLAVIDGSLVFVRDVAEVRLAHKKPDGFVKRFGTESIAVNVVRRTGANVLDIMEKLRAVNEQLNNNLLADQQLSLTQVYDETEYIHSSMNMVRENIFSGAALTMITLMLFLHLGRNTMLFSPLVALSAVAAIYFSSWFFLVTLALILYAGFTFARAALVVSVAIPVSIVGTFLLLHTFGRSLNVISLAGTAFAVGMLVDNAIVVLENIARHHQMGATPMQAAERGTREVWLAVLASTLTTLAVFVPVVFMREEAGQLFGDIALAISGAIALSFVVSVTVIPVAAARMLNRMDTPETNPELAKLQQQASPAANLLGKFGSAFSRGIDQLNNWLQDSWQRRVGAVLGTVAVTGLLLVLLRPQLEYLPNGNRNLIFGLIMPPPGYNLRELNHLGQIAEDELKPLWDTDADTPEARQLPFPLIEDFFFVTRERQVFLGMRSHDPLKAGRLVPAVFPLSQKMPGSFAVAFQASLFQQGLQGGRAINVEITGPELTELVQYGMAILTQVNPVLGAGSQARPIPSLDLSNPEIHVVPKPVQAAEMQISNEELGYTVNALVDGAYAGDYFDQGEKIDMSIMGKVGTPGTESFTQDIAVLPVAVADGRLVPIGSIADVTISSGPEQILHRERQRAIQIEVTPPPHMALEDAIFLINSKILAPLQEKQSLKSGYNIHLSGTADKLTNTWHAVRWNLVLAFLITYLLMVALYESWVYPFVIILTVPLGAVGGFVGLQLLNLYLMLLGEMPQKLDVITMLGFIILIGTVVNNPILIVDQALQSMRDLGWTPRNAVLHAAKTRIRPIFMTTLTTLLGLAPLVLFPGAGSELYRGLGSVLFGGLLVSTVLTLVFVPTLFTLWTDLEPEFKSDSPTLEPQEALS